MADEEDQEAQGGGQEIDEEAQEKRDQKGKRGFLEAVEDPEVQEAKKEEQGEAYGFHGALLYAVAKGW